MAAVFDSQALNPFLVPNLPFDTEKDFSIRCC